MWHFLVGRKAILNRSQQCYVMRHLHLSMEGMLMEEEDTDVVHITSEVQGDNFEAKFLRK